MTLTSTQDIEIQILNSKINQGKIDINQTNYYLTPL